ncbi:MAG: hypothetical protein ACK47B_29265 [Armatimonadota bacterium]
MRSPARLAAGAALLGALLIGTALSPRSSGAQALSGFDLFRSNCDGCHPLPDPEEPKRSRAEWEKLLNEMVKVRGAALNEQEVRAVLGFLDSFNRPERQIEWVETPAASRKAVFSAADAGKLPAEWVDLTLGGDASIPWSVQADTAGKAAWVAPMKEAPESHYPALIDNTGLVRSGTVATRFRISGGKKAAGLIFGYRSPQSYYGVRVTPTDVLLYEVNGTRPALLARVPMAVPLNEWHTLSVELTEKEVQVSLNGKPLPQLQRPLPAYQGGRVGLMTQGDTVARFDQWSISVR